MEAYDRLKLLVDAAGDDVAKAERGNKAAGVRVRKQMQEIKKVAQEVRVGVLELRSAEAGGPGAPPPAGPPPAVPPVM